MLTAPTATPDLIHIPHPDPHLYNPDLAPTAPLARTWTTYNYIALWFSMSMEVTTYMLAAGLIAGGMSALQAIATVLLGNLIVLIPMLLNAHAGAKYGIPFPVFVRAPFGPLGANIPAILRAIVACGWFGIQCWIGGLAIAAMLNVIAPVTLTHNITPICFLAFWALNMAVVWRGVESIRFLQSFSAPLMAVLSLALLAFMYHRAGGLGPILSTPSKFHTTHDFLAFFLPALTGMVGYWATLSLNIPDFTRYAKSQESQVLGQSFGLPVAMTLYASLGIACTSASAVVFGQPIWSPVELLSRFHQPLVATLALIGLLVATLNVNIGANVVGPSNDFANLAPNHISFRTGGLITGALGIAIMPWRLLSSSSSFTSWLVGYGGFLGPVAGIMIADYFLIRHRTLSLAALYQRPGPYEYTHGFNPRAIIALAAGIAMALVGLAVPTLHWLYSGAWFTGFFTAAILYLLLMRGRVPSGKV